MWRPPAQLVLCVFCSELLFVASEPRLSDDDDDDDDNVDNDDDGTAQPVSIATNARYVVGSADSVGEQAVTYLPGEAGRTMTLVPYDPPHDGGGRHSRLAAADHPRTNRTAFVVPAEYLAHTAV